MGAPAAGHTRRVVLRSLFDGVGSAYVAVRAWTSLPVSYHAVEIDPAAIRCTQEAWPDAVTHHGDITTLTDDWCHDFGKSLMPQTLLLITAGSPCQDNSALRGPQRQGLQGASSSLFWHVILITSDAADELTRWTV